MPKCSYCKSSNHVISQCNVDNDLMNFMMDSHKCPNFDKMSLPLLKRINAHCGYVSSVRISKLISNAYLFWENKKKENICSICYETLEYENSCITICNHRFCLDCILQANKTCVKQKREDFTCPICRKVLITYIGLARNNSFESIIIDTDETSTVNVIPPSNEINNANGIRFSISNLINYFRYNHPLNDEQDTVLNMQINTDSSTNDSINDGTNDVFMDHFTNDVNIHSIFDQNNSS